MAADRLTGVTDRLTARRDPGDPLVLALLLVVSVAVVTGTLVAAAFLLPRTVGALISGRALLALGLAFVGSVLAVLVAVPDERPTGHRPTEESVGGGATGHGPVRQRLVDLRREVDGPVFYPGVALCAAVVVAFVAVPERTGTAVAAAESFVFVSGRELLLGAIFVFVLGAGALAAGPWGAIRLGGEDATPAFSTPSYVAMLFSAGIAAGIVFWGPAEAVFHYGTVPPFLDAEPRSEAAVVGALRYTLFHWGVSAWSTYLVVGLPIAYAAYNMDAPLRVSSALAPLLGPDVADRAVGRVVDVLAVVATLGGLSTTLGFVSAQFLTGIEYRWSVGLGEVAQVLLVVGLTAIISVSVVAGVRRGMGRLSTLNSLTFAALLVALAAVAPLGFVAETGADAVGGYLTGFVSMSLYAGPGGDDWLSAWTIFYWAWWLSWAPFVGLFLARISRGRRVRTVVGATVGATSLATLTWFVLVGATTLHLQQAGSVDFLGVIDDAGVAVAGFPLFDALTFGTPLVVLFLLLVITFFITSAVAATHSLALLTTRTDDPSPTVRVLLAAFVGVIAAVLILFGGRGAVRSAAVVTGGPVALVALAALAGISYRFVRREIR